jgi:hypothetical protein
VKSYPLGRKPVKLLGNFAAGFSDAVEIIDNKYACLCRPLFRLLVCLAVVFPFLLIIYDDFICATFGEIMPY